MDYNRYGMKNYDQGGRPRHERNWTASRPVVYSDTLRPYVQDTFLRFGTRI